MESIPHMAARPARDILPRRVVGSGRGRLDLKPARTGSTGHSAKSVTHQEEDALQATTTDGEQISAPRSMRLPARHYIAHGMAWHTPVTGISTGGTCHDRLFVLYLSRGVCVS